MDQTKESNEQPRIDSAAEKTSQKMMREALASYGLNNFESALDAVEHFLGNLNLFNPDISFGTAAEALNAAAAAFALIDENHDQRLSRSELTAFSQRVDAKAQQLVEWILMHYDALQRAGFGHNAEGISRFDLVRAFNFFRGLEYIHENFDKIASQHGAQTATLNHADIDSYLVRQGAEIDAKSSSGLKALSHYLRNLELHGHPRGLTQTEIDKIQAEDVWES